MKRQITVLGMSLSILFLSVSLHDLTAQDLTTNNSNAAVNLSASNLSNAAVNLSASNLSNAAANLSASNLSNAATNLSASNLSNAATNLSASADQTIGELGQKLSAFVKSMNTTTQSKNSSLSQLGQNSTDLGLDLQNKTDEATK